MVLLQIQSHTASVSRKSLFLCSPDLILSTLGLLRFCSRNDCRAILPEHSNICKHCSAACPVPRCTICRFPVRGTLFLFFIHIFFDNFRRSFAHLSEMLTCDSYFMLGFVGCYCSYMPFRLWMLLYGIWWSFHAAFYKAWSDTSLSIHVLPAFWILMTSYDPGIYNLSNMLLFSSRIFWLSLASLHALSWAWTLSWLQTNFSLDCHSFDDCFRLSGCRFKRSMAFQTTYVSYLL